MKIKLNRIDELLLKIDLYHLNAAQRLIDLFSPFDPKSAIEAQRLNSELGYHVSQIRPLYDMSQLLIEFAENNLYSPFRGPLDVPMSETTRQMVAGFYDDFFKKARENLNERLTTVKQARANAKRQKQAEREKAKTIASVAVENIQSKKHVVELTGNIVPPEATFHDGDQGDPMVVLPEKSVEEIAVVEALKTLIDTRYNLMSGSEKYEEVNQSKLYDASRVLSVQNTMTSKPISGADGLVHLIEMAIYHYAFQRFETIKEATRKIADADQFWFQPKYLDWLAGMSPQQRGEFLNDVAFLEREIKEKVVKDWKVTDADEERFYREAACKIQIVKRQSCVFSELAKRYNALATVIGSPKMPDLVITASPRLFMEYTTKLFEAFREFNDAQR